MADELTACPGDVRQVLKVEEERPCVTAAGQSDGDRVSSVSINESSDGYDTVAEARSVTDESADNVPVSDRGLSLIHI